MTVIANPNSSTGDHLELKADVALAHARLTGHINCVWAVSSDASPRTMPLAIPSDQQYYWSRLWQDGVAVSRDALARGDYVDFTSDDPDDVVRWLLDLDDDV